MKHITIDHLDTLGQGVSQHSNGIIFTRKTLPEEVCDVRITKSKKGVHFAQLINIQTASEERIEAECPHYSTCPGCSYLHTSYDNELTFKVDAFKKHLKHIIEETKSILTIASPQRFHYRNRVQLHYRNKHLGLIDGVTNTIVEIPHCKLIRPELQKTMEKLYDHKDFPKNHDKKNKKHFKGNSGHCEIYLKNNRTHITWNEAYADGGFSQVNAFINEKLIATIKQLASGHNHQSILDLFSGTGNLSNTLCEQIKSRTMLDVSEHQHPDFIRTNLYDENALLNFNKKSTTKSFDLLLIDPPRKGFNALNEWVKKFKPKQLIYVSCSPATLARDLKQLTGKYLIDDVILLDMFPGTHHFESIVSIVFKKH